MAILFTTAWRARAPVRAAALGVGARRGDRDGRSSSAPTSSRRSSPATLADLIAGVAFFLLAAALGAADPLPDRLAAARARPGQAARARAAGARAARHGRPPRLGDRDPRPGRPHARRHAARRPPSTRSRSSRRRRRARSRSCAPSSGRCATATRPTSRRSAASPTSPGSPRLADGPRVDVELVGRPRRPAADGRRRRLPDRPGVDHQRGPARATRDPGRRPRHRRAGQRARRSCSTTASRPPRSAPGYGLAGMTERAALLGGTLEAGPSAGGGWLVTATLPRNGA